VTRLEGVVLTFLLNALWQAAFLAGLAGAGAWLLRRASSAHRHRLWFAALALAVLSPIATTAGLARSVGDPRGRAPVAARDVLVPSLAVDPAAVAKHLGLRTGYPWRPLAAPAVALYLLFLVSRLTGLGIGWQRASQVVRRAVPAPSLLARAGLDRSTRAPDVRLSPEVEAPMTFGLLRPVIVLPSRLLSQVPSELVRGALAHEMSHVARRDCAWNLAAELLALPLFFHPAAHFLKRRLAGAREGACDEAATAIVGARAYAQTLVGVAGLACGRPAAVGALGVLDGESLEERMKRILDGRPAMGPRVAMLFLVALVAGLAGASRLSTAAGVAVTTEAGPSEMVGHWTAAWPEGGPGGPAADLTIALTPNGPDVVLTLYRHDGGQGKEPVAERLPVVQHSVKDGVLYFRTRARDAEHHPSDAAGLVEADWRFAVVGKDAGELTLLRKSAVGSAETGPPASSSPPPLAMKRVLDP
jgi:beta-lactamase regulating signal transducer with metallopeptidase domain